MRLKDSTGCTLNKAEGASPLFPPVHLDAESAAAELRGLLYRSPRLFDLPRTRWWLDGLRQQVKWLRPLSLAGVCLLLKRLGVRYKRGRRALHSPDLAYERKLVQIEQAAREAVANPGKKVLLFEDEHTLHRQPGVAWAYAGAEAGSNLDVPLYPGYDCERRIAGCLDLVTGALISMQRNHFPAETFAKFLELVEEQYPDAQTISIVLDNWPVHFAPPVLDSLHARHSRIRLLRLPTYAPWANPIEKVWHCFNQHLTHLHPFACQWKTLRQVVDEWLADKRPGSKEMLEYVGLADGYHLLHLQPAFPPKLPFHMHH